MKKAAWIAAAAALFVIAAAGVAIGLNANKEEELVEADFTVNYEGIETKSIRANVSVHDPSIVEKDGVYYIFGSHMVGAFTTDFRKWSPLGNGYTEKNTIFDNIFAEGLSVFDYAGSAESVIPTDDRRYHVWAPDVVYNKAQGLYYMYYCTSSTWNASNLCYGVSEKIEGPYQWKGPLIYSGFTMKNIDKTDVLDYVDEAYAKEHYITLTGEYNFGDFPNAIDPTVFYDKDGRLWMVYGSWSGGIFLLEIDESTGEVIHPAADEEHQVDPYFGKRLLGGGHNSIEGPYIIYDDESGYYYLFVSYGSLISNGGYQIRVFRSESVDGDYVDMNGERPQKNAQHFKYGLKLSGNYFLPGLKIAYMATGHNSALIDGDGKRYICYHTRFDDGSEYHEPRVKQYFLNEEGWPCMLPYATGGETLSPKGYKADEVAGKYYVVNQGTGISDKIAEPFMLVLTKKGRVAGDGVEGTWEMKKGTCYMKLTYKERTYSGVFCAMQDEAGTDVMTFTAVGENESVWGVSYAVDFHGKP